MQKLWTLGLCGLAASIACTLTVWGQEGQSNSSSPRPINGGEELASPLDREQTRQLFLQIHPGIEFYESVGRITKIYGRPFGSGQSARDSAEQFRLNYAGMFGLPANDIVPIPGFEGGQHLQPIMFENGRYKFTGVNYSQVRDGLSVYRSRLIVLARNDADFPLVLASADLRDLGAFTVDQQMLGRANPRAGTNAARKMMPAGTVFTPATPVIFAGVDDQIMPPVLAMNFIGEGGDFVAGTYSRREFVTDATTGAILFTENLIYDVDVEGSVKGMVTDNFVADACAAENLAGLPYLRVGIGATNVFADVNGNFTIPNAGSGVVTVNSPLIGQYFVVNNQQSATSSIAVNVLPPGPANIVHNESNGTEGARAEVNAYLHANLARDRVVTTNPVYPTIATQTGFPINVNIGQNCNAFYNGSSINFYVAGGGCNNTGFGTVAHHEYGHHVVARGGSGQGAYGEGMSDCLGVLVTDNSDLGLGFQSCTTPLRDADNTCQYVAGANCSSCGSAIHSCGRLISGCIWSLRNNLLATNPSTYREILSDLTVNSILLHTGTLITPQITIDFLTLDDDDANINNGTPHYAEIADAFGDHNMPAPEIIFLVFTYPNGRPAFVDPSGGTVLSVNVAAGAQLPEPGATLFVDSGSGFVGIPMTPVASNAYEASFPPSACGSTVKYYVSTETTAATVVRSPSNAPTSFFSSISAVGVGADVFADNFQTDTGWVVTNAALTDGAWVRGVPVPLATCDRGNPGVDADGSGSCFVTDNGPQADCNTDVDGGTTTMTSPNMDATAPASVLSYWRWYDNIHPQNSSQDDTFRVDVSFNGGGTWQGLESVGPTGPETNGGWVQKSFLLSALPNYVATSQFKVRFTAADANPGSVVEAAVDGVRLSTLLCSDIPGDVNGDGNVDVTDLLAVISAWGPCPALPTPCPADVTDDGFVNVSDLLLVISNWG